MDGLNEADTALLRLHEAGWSIGDTASVGASGTVRLVFETRGGRSIKAEGGTRAETRRQKCAWRFPGSRRRT